MNFFELLTYCKSRAILSKLEPSEESIWRRVCRQYSKKFHTPLHLVLAMEPEDVILTEYEDQMDEMDLHEDIEDILEQIYHLSDDDYGKKKDAETKEFVDRVEKALAAKKALADKKVEPKKTVPKPEVEGKKMPSQGGVNLSYLDKEEESGY